MLRRPSAQIMIYVTLVRVFLGPPILGMLMITLQRRLIVLCLLRPPSDLKNGADREGERQ
jgi:hypothetical protein